MNKKIQLILVLLLLTTSGLFLYKSRQAGSLNADLAREAMSLKAMSTAFADNTYFNLLQPALQTTRFVNERNDSVNIDAIFPLGTVKMVLHLKENQCMDCIDGILHLLAGLSALIGESNIILLTTYRNFSEISRLKKVRNIPYRLYNSPQDLFEAPIEKITLPSLFLLDGSMNARSLFFISTGFSDGTKLYLQSIRKYFEKEYQRQYPVTIPKTTSVNFEVRSFDLGSIIEDQPAQIVAKFSNSGGKSLVITSVSTGCGCTVVSYSREPLQPKDSSSIVIKYDAKRVGAFDRTIFVYSNAKESPTMLRIKGEVKKAI